MESAIAKLDSLPLGKGVFGGVATLLMVLTFPGVAGSLVFVLLGWILVRSALRHRQTGWVGGVLFGSLLLLAPAGGWLYGLFVLSTR